MSSVVITDTPIRTRIGAHDFASTFGTNVAIQICTIVQAILLARLLEPTGRGQFAAAILWPSIFAAVGGMGVGVALARCSARATDLARLTRTAIVLTLATSALATICCAAALPWLMANVDEVSRSAAWYFLPYIVFNHVALGLIAIDQGAGRFRQFNLTRLILNPAYLVVIVCLWLSGTRDVHWYVIGLMAANGLVAMFRVALAAWNYSLIGPLEPIVGVIRQALPYGAAGLISPLLQSADKALVLYLVGTTQLGIYTVALTAASVINSLATSAGTVSFGIAAQEHDSGAFPRMARMFRFTAWIWLVAGVCLAAVIPVLLPLIYGSQFSPAIWPAIVLIPAAAFAGQAGILEESMRTRQGVYRTRGAAGRHDSVSVLGLATGGVLGCVWRDAGFRHGAGRGVGNHVIRRPLAFHAGDVGELSAKRGRLAGIDAAIAITSSNGGPSIVFAALTI